MNLNNKHVFVTGGTSGLGLSLCRHLLEKGAIVSTCSRSQTSLDQASQTLNHPQFHTHVCDVTDYGQLETLASKFENLDALINNAGVWLEGPLDTNSPHQIYQTININIVGPIYTTKAFLSLLQSAPDAFIVNIVSTSGLGPRPSRSVYCASKYALRGFGDSLRLDLSESNIKIASIYPGGMATELFTNAGFNKDTSKYLDPDLVAQSIAKVLEQDPSIEEQDVVIQRSNK